MRRAEPDGKTIDCDGRCSACEIASGAPAQGELQGAALTFWSAAVFLWPLAGMALGAALAGPGGVRQVVGALAGGAVCAGMARCALRRRQSKLLQKETT